MDVSIVTVAYNSAACIKACLESVLAQQDVRKEIVLVDNASSDQTVDVIHSLGDKVRSIRNEQNVGFGRACNQAFACCQGRYIYLLNPDAQLIGRNALSSLCRALEQHPTWGLAGTRILDADGRPKGPPPSSYPDQGRVRHDFDRLPGSIAWAVGASLIIRREVFARVGGFDPDFFLYGEETDLCLRVRKLGFEIGYVDEVAVRHIGGQSEAGRDPYEVWTRRSNGIHLFWQKHYRPEDVVRLLRRDRFRSRYRMLVHGLQAQFLPAGSVAWQKHRRYRAIWESCCSALSRNVPGKPG